MTEWHPPQTHLEHWMAGTARLAEAASIEQHIPGCETCQMTVAAGDVGIDLEEVWGSVLHQIEPQPLNLVGRALTLAGASPGDALIVSAAPSLSTAWITGVALTLTFAMMAAGSSGTRGVALFLLVAPLAPLLGIALAFGDDDNPLFELTVATPYSKFRLLLWRSAAVVATTIPITVIGTVAIHKDWWIGAIWLIPALALCSVALALARWFELQFTASAIAIGWILIQGAELTTGRSYGAFSSEALIAYAVVAVVALIVFVRGRAETFDRQGP